MLCCATYLTLYSFHKIAQFAASRFNTNRRVAFGDDRQQFVPHGHLKLKRTLVSQTAGQRLRQIQLARFVVHNKKSIENPRPYFKCDIIARIKTCCG